MCITLRTMARVTLSLSESPRSLGREPPKLGGWLLFLSPTGYTHQENPHRPGRPHVLFLEDKTPYLCLFLSLSLFFMCTHTHTDTHTHTHIHMPVSRLEYRVSLSLSPRHD